ncbi:MAG: DUF308 domain-containing protein [Microbacterium sp.]
MSEHDEPHVDTDTTEAETADAVTADPIAESAKIIHDTIGAIARRFRFIALASGVIALIAGVIILIWPVKSMVAVTVLIAIYAIVAGLIDVSLGIRLKGAGGWTRAWFVVLGVLLVVSGIVAFVNLGATTASLAVIISMFIGIAWIVEGFISLFSLGDARRGYTPAPRSRGWTIAFAIISIIGGVAALLSGPLLAGWLWLIFGAFLVIAGVTQIFRAAVLEH